MHKMSVELPDELEGNYIPPEDLSFKRIGKAISIAPGHQYDLNFPPSQPLTVSHVHRLLFLAHSFGFFVARTKDVIDAAVRGKLDGSVRDVCLVDVNDLPYGFRVRTLALSADDSTLAVVSFSQQIIFYSAASFLNQEKVPCFSCSLNEKSVIKDLQWRTTDENSFLVISKQGELHYGTLCAPPKCVLDNVDAVAWSPRGNFVAAARENNIEIFSSDFKKELSLSLRFESWVGSSADNMVKVDSIQWVRDDSVVVGCFQHSDSAEEESYLIQVITSVNGKITDVDSEYILRSFYEIFIGVADNLLPAGTGPYLMLSYLKSCQLAIIANKKNTDQHIVFLGWSGEEGNTEVAVLELLDDSWRPRIELQGNDDDNLILGLCIDELSIYGKINVEVGNEEYKERLPSCVLICLTLDGKLVMYHVISGESGARNSSFDDVEQDIPDKFYSGFDNDVVSSQHSVGTSKGSDTDFLHYGYNSHQASIALEVNRSSAKYISSSNEVVDKSLASSVVRDSSNAYNASTNLNTRGNYLLAGTETSKSGFQIDNFSTRSELSAFSIGRVVTDKKPIDPLPSISGQPLRSLLEDFGQGSSTSFALKNTYKLPTMQKSEEAFSNQFESIRDMTKELDKLILGIEEARDNDARNGVQSNSVDEMERDMISLIKKCQSWKAIAEERHNKIQNIIDETVQVQARKLYMDDIFKQYTDKKFWDVWDQQKLDSELELKRKRIKQLSQNIVSKIMDLEKHLNSIEFQKFSESDILKRNKREPTRSSVSLQSLQNTMCMQIFAAEQLSERLMKQMNQLSIQLPIAKRNAKTELFESIGITQDSSLKSPDATINEKRNAIMPPNILINVPSESRRNRDSIQTKLKTMTPTKTTMKRTVIPDHEKPVQSRSSHARQSETLNPQNHKGTITAFQSPPSINKGQKIDIVSTTNSETSKMSGITVTASSLLSFPAPTRVPNNDSIVSPLFTSPAHSGVRENDQFSPNLLPSPSHPVFGKLNQPVPALFSSPIHSEVHKKDPIVAPLFPSPSHSGVLEKDKATPTLFSSTSHSGTGEKAQFTPNLFSSSSHSGVGEKEKITPTLFPSPSQIDTSLLSPPHLEMGKNGQNATASVSPSTLFEVGKNEQTTSFSLPISLQKSSPKCDEPSFVNKIPSKKISSDNSGFRIQFDVSKSPKKSEPIPAVGFSSASSLNQSNTPEKPSPPLPSSSNDTHASSGAPPTTISSETPKVVVTTSVNVPLFTQPPQNNEDAMEPEKADDLDEEDGMEEEAPENNQANFLSFANLGGFGGFGTGTGPQNTKQSSPNNPFGPSFGSAPPTSLHVAPSGDIFRNASFTVPPPAATVPTPPVNFSGFGAHSSFGQPPKLGAAQQALDSVLGSFGQSRQLGSGLGFVPGGNNASSGGGGGSGFSAMASSGRGFAGLGSGGGFVGAASSGGFAGAASSGSFGGGFAGAASAGGFGGGFARAASSSGLGSGFSGAASSGGLGSGFSGAGGGFGSGFAGTPSSSGFSGGFGAFGGSTGGSRSDLFTQMRK